MRPCDRVFDVHGDGVPDSVIADCVRSSGFPDGTQYAVEEVFRTDGLGRRVVRSAAITATQAHQINMCIESRVMGRSALPTVAGVPQRIETVQTATGFRETFIYGTPPTSEPAIAPVRPTDAPRPTVAGCVPGGGVMQGGTGYCVGN